MASEFSAIAGDVSTQLTDVTFGVATYRDYAMSPFGSPGDLPLRLEQQQTSDTAAVQGALGGLSVGGGGDGPEATDEALVQALTGAGYDLDCDGALDGTDVPHFVSGPADAFGGAVAGTSDPSVPGTGTLGGVGFREDVAPIVVYATDAPLRDPDAGYGAPGGCPSDATGAAVIAGAAALHARLVAVAVGGLSPWDQMVDLATATGSTGDLDGDGVVEPAVVSWSGSSAQFRTAVADALVGLATSGTFATLELVELSDPDDVVIGVTPASYADVPSGAPVTFTLDVVGDVVEVATATSATAVLGLSDGRVVLDTRVIFVEPW
jgi:hypothetical protein